MKLPALLALAFLGVAACNNVPSDRYNYMPQFVMTNVDASRLEGTWYELAYFPEPIRRGCESAVTRIGPRADGGLGFVSTCRLTADPTVTREATGILGHADGGKMYMKVAGSALGGEYWILDISPDGRLMIVGSPARYVGWVLSRDSKLTPQMMDRAKAVFERSGYDIAALQRSKRLP